MKAQTRKPIEHRVVRTQYTGVMVCTCGKLAQDCTPAIRENEQRAFNFHLAARNDEY